MLLTKELLREFIRENNLTTARDIQNALKDVFASTLQEMLEAELDEQLGYTKYDYKNKTTKNSRNGTSPNRILSDLGEVDLAVPRETGMENLSRRPLRKNRLIYYNIYHKLKIDKEAEVLAIMAKAK